MTDKQKSVSKLKLKKFLDETKNGIRIIALASEDGTYAEGSWWEVKPKKRGCDSKDKG